MSNVILKIERPNPRKIVKNTTTARCLAQLLRSAILLGCGIRFSRCGFKPCRGACAANQHHINPRVLSRRIIITSRDSGNGVVFITVKPKVDQGRPRAIIPLPISFSVTYEELSAYALKIPRKEGESSLAGVCFITHCLAAVHYIADTCAVCPLKTEPHCDKECTNVKIVRMRGQSIQSLALARVPKGRYSFSLVKLNPLTPHGDLLYPSRTPRSRRGKLAPTIRHPLSTGIYAANTARDAAPLIEQLTAFFTKKEKALPHDEDVAYGLYATFRPFWTQVMDDSGVSKRPYQVPTIERLMSNVNPHKTTVVPTQSGLMTRRSAIDSEINAYLGEYQSYAEGKIGNYLAGLTYKSEVAGVASSYIQFDVKPTKPCIVFSFLRSPHQEVDIVIHPRKPIKDCIHDFTIPCTVIPFTGVTPQVAVVIPQEYVGRRCTILVLRRMNEAANPHLTCDLIEDDKLYLEIYEAGASSAPKTVSVQSKTHTCGVSACAGITHTYYPHLNRYLCPAHVARLRNIRGAPLGDITPLPEHSPTLYREPQFERAKFQDGRNIIKPRLIFRASTTNMMSAHLVREEFDRMKGYGGFATGSKDFATRLSVTHNAYQDGRVLHADDNSGQDQTLSKRLERVFLVFAAMLCRPDPTSPIYPIWVKQVAVSLVACSEMIIPISRVNGAVIDMNNSGTTATTFNASADTLVKQASFVHKVWREETDPAIKERIGELLDFKPREVVGPPVIHDPHLLKEYKDTISHPDAYTPRRKAYLTAYHQGYQYLKHKYRSFEMITTGYGQLVLGDDKTFSYPDKDRVLDSRLGQVAWAHYSVSLGMKIKENSLYQGQTTYDPGGIAQTCITCPSAEPLPTPRSFKLGGCAYTQVKLYYLGDKTMPYVTIHEPVFDPARSNIRDALTKHRFRQVHESTELTAEYFRICARASAFSAQTQPYYHELYDRHAEACHDYLTHRGVNPHDDANWSTDVEETLRYKRLMPKYLPPDTAKHSYEWDTDTILKSFKVCQERIQSLDPPKVASRENLARDFGLSNKVIDNLNEILLLLNIRLVTEPAVVFTL